MSDRIHRFIMFGVAVAVGFVGIAGVGDLVSHLVLGWISLAAALGTIVGNSWRILFPETPPAP